MAKVCPITNKGSKMAQTRVNRFRANFYIPGKKVRRQPNLQTKKVYVPELEKSVRVTASTKGHRTIKKRGAFKALKEAGII